MKTIYYLLITASLLALLLNRRRLDRRLYLFIPLLLLALVPDGLKDVLGEQHWLQNFFFSIYTPVEYTLLCLVLISYLKKKRLRMVIYISIPVFILVSLSVQLWLKQGDSFFEYLDILIESPLLCTWTLLYFFQLAADKDETGVVRNPMFWIAIGNLIFFSSSIFSYGFGGYLEYVAYEKKYIDFVYNLGRYANLLLYIFYIIAFSLPWMKRKL
jgi:hypothetical protein